MFKDQQLMLSDDQNVTTTANSENIIDLGAAKDLGPGNPLDLAVTITAAVVDSGDDATLNVALVVDSATNLATTAVTLWSRTFTHAEIDAAGAGGGFLAYVPGVIRGASRRYCGLIYTVANGAMTTCQVQAFLCKGKPGNVAVKG